jgi:hypothetical protein
MKRLVEKARGTVRANVRSAEDVLNAYIREHYGKFISVKVTNDGQVEATYANSQITDESLTRTQVFGRVERHMTPGYVNFFIEEALLKQYCSSMSFGYADLRKELEKLYRVDYVKKDMLAKTKGPQMRVNALKISRPEADVFEIGLDETPSPLPVE